MFKKLKVFQRIAKLFLFFCCNKGENYKYNWIDIQKTVNVYIPKFENCTRETVKNIKRNSGFCYHRLEEILANNTLDKRD